jgi:hypothetical protein
MDLELIHLWRKNDGMLTGDLHGVDMGIDVSFDQQLSRLFVDGTKIASLFWVKGMVKTCCHGPRELMAMLT